LNRAYIAPSGHVVLQKGRFVSIKSKRKKIKITILRPYFQPIIPGSITGSAKVGSTGFHKAHGIPAIMVPQGHIRENQ
jgi:hypothetical protein